MYINNNNTEIGEVLGEALQHEDAPEVDSTADTKLTWLRSQIIGQDAYVHTPFGKRKLTYADHTATGRCLQYIEDYIVETVLPFYGNTHTSDSYVGVRTMSIVHKATKLIKKWLGGTQDDTLIFCGSGTTAAIKRLQEVMGITIPSILKEKVLNSCVGSEERWVVFVGPYEHHSNLLSWRQSLAEVIEIGLDDEGLIDMDDLRFQLEFYKGTGRPMLGSFSACSNVTGICSDTGSLSRLLHEFGAFAHFDFAASGPYVEIDLRSGDIDGYDAISLSPHKFLGGPGSPGILLMNNSLYRLKNYPPSTCGGGTVNYVNYFDEKDTLYVHDIEEREDAGTPQIIQRVKAALAFQVKEYIGYKVIADKEREYTTRALKRLSKNRNIWMLGNTKGERQAIVSFLVYSSTTSALDVVGNHTSSKKIIKRDHKPLNGTFVANLLNDLFGIQARGGCTCAGPYGHHLLGIDKPLSLAIKSAVEMGYNGLKPGWTRVSFPYYMYNEEHEFILSAIEFIANYGEYFLPLYDFNWYTGSWKFKTNAFYHVLLKEKDCKICTSLFIDASNVSVVKENIDLKTQKNVQCKKAKDTHFATFSSYLEVAKHIGSILPTLAPIGTIPEGINPEDVWFRVALNGQAACKERELKMTL